MSEKKSVKQNWQEFEDTCRSYGFSLFQLDKSKSLESQEPFCIFLHKLSDVIAAANEGDVKSINLMNDIENYLSKNPSVVVIDPIPNVRKLLDRYSCYSIINDLNLEDYGVFTPNFCKLRSISIEDNQKELKAKNVTYPFICKPILGHGSRKAHSMSIIFNEKGLIDCRIPCVAHSFINHNAILYKIYIVGEQIHYVKRPSLKNYHAGEQETIHFDSSDVSKAGAQSLLTKLDPEDVVKNDFEPNVKTLNVIACVLRKAFGMDLLGVDVVIENTTGKYFIIDVNIYPGYDGFPNFFHALSQLFSNKINNH